MKQKTKPPRNPTAICKHHDKLMNDAYIRRKGCMMRQCKHLKWLRDGAKQAQ